MRNTPAWLRVVLMGAGLMVGGVLAGCQPPKGQSSGRIGISDTAEPEYRRSAVLPVVLVEFSDQFPQRLVQDLDDVPQLRDTPGRATIILGDINNRTRIVSTNDFEVLVRRIRNNLINSNPAQDRLQFVERRARMSQLAQRERVAGNDGLADPPDYDPATTYALNGDFYRVSRGDSNYYYLEVQLVHFGTNEIVFSDRYESKHVEAH